MSGDVLESTAAMVRDAAMKTAEEILKEKTKDIADLIARVIPQLAASVLSQFSAQFAIVCLRALADNHQNEKILQQLNKLVAAPLQTGLLQLRTAIDLEARLGQESMDEQKHRISRYQDALRKLDEALSLAKDDEEKAAIHLMRAVASTRITGAQKEARLHALEYGIACEKLAAEAVIKASSEEKSADRNERSAGKIAVDGGMGAGGGAVGWSESADKLKKKQFEYMARTDRHKAVNLRKQALHLKESSAVLLAMVHEHS